MDRAKLLLLIIYLKDQEKFFVEDYYLLDIIAHSLSPKKELVPLSCKLPVICRRCARTFGVCIGGAIKNGCHECYSPSTPWQQQYLRFYYSSRIAEILNCSTEVLEGYMSLAMYFNKIPSIALATYGELLEKVNTT